MVVARKVPEQAVTCAGIEAQLLHEAPALVPRDVPSLALIEEPEAVCDSAVLLAGLRTDQVDNLVKVLPLLVTVCGPRWRRRPLGTWGLTQPLPGYGCALVVNGGLVARLDVWPDDCRHLLEVNHAIPVNVQHVEEAVSMLLGDVQDMAELTHFRPSHRGIVILVKEAKALLHGAEALCRLGPNSIANLVELPGTVLRAPLAMAVERRCASCRAG